MSHSGLKPYSVPLALYYLRVSRGMTQSALARASDLGQDFISHIERGNKKPSLETLEKVLDVLGISLSGFFALAERIAEGDPEGRLASGELDRESLLAALRALAGPDPE